MVTFDDEKTNNLSIKYHFLLLHFMLIENEGAVFNNDGVEADAGEMDPVVLVSILESIILAQLEDGASSPDIEYMFSLLFSIPPTYATSVTIKHGEDEVEY